MYSIYLHKSTFRSPRAAKARKAALNAVDRCLNKRGPEIENRFGIQDYIIVI
jgi:hypothetical protein